MKNDKQIIAWQRLEGLLLLCFSLFLYGSESSNWWLFGALFLVPDVSMLGYLINPKIGAFCYNAFHSLVFPILLFLSGSIADLSAVWLISLVWVAHIGMDRALGYGLKYNDDFKHTHLGRIGKK